MLWFKVLNNKEVLMCPMDAVLAPSLLPGSLLDLCQHCFSCFGFPIASLPLLVSNAPPAPGPWLFSSRGASVTPARLCHLSLSLSDSLDLG